MDTASARRPPLSSSAGAGGLMRSITKIMRFRRGHCLAANSTTVDDDHMVTKLPDRYHHDNSSLSKSEAEDDDAKKQQQQAIGRREAMESLLAGLFAAVSAIKAAYAQLQLAQSPYDPEAIQAADLAVVTEFKHISHLKHAYLRNQLSPSPLHPDDAQLAAEVQEQRNLLKTFQITVRKLEVDIRSKDAAVGSLQGELLEAERRNSALEARLHPRRSLSVLGDLQLSGLNPTHFLAVLRYAVKSIRSFVGAMVREMEAAGWDLAAAAAAIEPDVACGRPDHHQSFAFESFVCRRMFADFQHAHFGGLPHPPLDGAPDRRRRFFDDFVEMKGAKAKDLLGDRRRGLDSPFGRFCWAKYEALVHPKMEVSFFGGIEQRKILNSGEGFPVTAFVLEFAEMARRVWLLHRLFFSFEDEAETAIFQCGRGCRFSEVYMKSVAEMAAAGEKRTVGFTVLPGFRVRKTVIQCRVYLVDGRS